MRSFLLLALVTGCTAGIIGDDDDRFDCTAEVVPSTLVTVVDGLGGAIPSAVVTFTLDGGPSTPCEAAGLPGEFVCGWEERGLITISADAQGHEEELAAVTVTGDDCHVDTKFVTLTLPEVNCTDEETPAVLVTPVDSEGNAIPDVKVEAMPLGENWTFPEACQVAGGETWACGPEWAGDIEIWVSAPTTGSWYDVVNVPADECGPITQSISPVVDRDPG
ncbi:MAG: hypothetical protein AB8H79_26380 [Myxococcota bacterium]